MKNFEEYIFVDLEVIIMKEKFVFMKNQYMVVIFILLLNIVFINIKNEIYVICFISEGWKGFVFFVIFCLKNICLWVCVKKFNFYL